jgi:hypothetical protein
MPFHEMIFWVENTGEKVENRSNSVFYGAGQ